MSLVRISFLLCTASCTAPSPWLEDTGRDATPPAMHAPPPGTIGLMASDPMQVGATVHLFLWGLQPGQRVLLYGARTQGGTPSCPAAIAPACLELTGATPRIAARTADSDGVAVVTVQVPDLPPGGLWLQAITTDGALASEVLQSDILGDEPEPTTWYGTGRLTTAATTFGPGIANVPKPWQSANLDKNRPNTAAGIAFNQIDDAVDLWDAGRWITEPAEGPRAIITIPLAWGVNNAKPGSHNNNRLSAEALADVARGDYDHIYHNLATDLLNASVGGYDDWPGRFVLRLAHEHNGSWYPWYSGLDLSLIGDSVLSASSDPLLQQLAVDGDRGPLFVAAYRRVVDVIRAVDDRFLMDINYAAPSADPDSGLDDLDRDWNPNAWPGADWVDVIGMDVYCRSTGRNLANLNAFLDAHAALAAQYDRPLSYPEVGVSLSNDVNNPAPEACTDAEAAAFMSTVFEWIDDHDVAYWQWWGATRTDQGNGGGYKYRPSPTLDPLAWNELTTWFGEP